MYGKSGWESIVIFLPLSQIYEVYFSFSFSVAGSEFWFQFYFFEKGYPVCWFNCSAKNLFWINFVLCWFSPFPVIFYFKKENAYLLGEDCGFNCSFVFSFPSYNSSFWFLNQKFKAVFRRTFDNSHVFIIHSNKTNYSTKLTEIVKPMNSVRFHQRPHRPREN